MKVVDIGFGAVGFEPNSEADRIEALDVTALRKIGISEVAIATFEAYREKYSLGGALPTKSGLA